MRAASCRTVSGWVTRRGPRRLPAESELSARSDPGGPRLRVDQRPGGAGPTRDLGGSEPRRGAFSPGGSPRACQRTGGARWVDRSPGGGRQLTVSAMSAPGGPVVPSRNGGSLWFGVPAGRTGPDECPYVCRASLAPTGVDIGSGSPRACLGGPCEDGRITSRAPKRPGGP